MSGLGIMWEPVEVDPVAIAVVGIIVLLVVIGIIYYFKRK